MQVILLENIKTLGKLGETVKVKPGYGRNYLIPQGKALMATAANQAFFEAKKAELEQAQATRLQDALARQEAIQALSLTLSARVADEGRLFGSISAQDIALAMTQAGVPVNKQEVRLPEGPIRMVGEHSVEVHLHADVNAQLVLTVVSE